MVKWSSSWLEHTDESNEQVKIGLWAVKNDHAFAACVLCHSELIYGNKGFTILRAKITRNYLRQSSAKTPSIYLIGQQSSSQSKPVVAVDAAAKLLN